VPHLILSPTRIPVPGGKVIDEYVGAVNTPTTALAGSVSVAHMVAPPGWEEPFQSPEFGEGAAYVAVCLPAFSPETVHREDE